MAACSTYLSSTTEQQLLVDILSAAHRDQPAVSRAPTVDSGGHRPRRLWPEPPNVGILEAAERYWSILREAFIEAQAVGPLVSDAALSALAIEHGATLATTDRDFARFAGLKTLDPLRDAG